MSLPVDTAPAQAPAGLKEYLKKPIAKKFPTPSKDKGAAERDEILRPQKQEEGQTPADCGTGAPSQKKMLPAEVLFNPAKETPQQLLAAGWLLREVTHPGAEAGAGSLSFFIPTRRPVSLPAAAAGAG